MSLMPPAAALPRRLAEFDAVLRGPERPDFLQRECLADLLAASAARWPQRTAIRGPAEASPQALHDAAPREATLTYAELHARAERLGRALRQQGAAPDDIVGLWLPRGVAALIAQAGIACAGAAWLAADADTPAARCAGLLREAGARLTISDAEGAAALAAHGIAALVLSELEAQSALPAPPFRAPAPEHAAYVIATSGTTGTPKLIVLTQANICHLLRAEHSMLGITADDVVYQGFSLAFDMSCEEIWIAYLAGACLWLPSERVRRDVEALPAALHAAGVSVLHTVPSLLALLPAPLPGVRLINVGGEACPPALAARFAGGPARLVNTYGPSETTVTATLADLRPGSGVTIGWPLPNYGVVILDDAQQPVPRGDVGELCICGPGVGRGYLGRSDLTAERFLANPWARGAHDAVLYRSGDLARLGEDGIHCLGRSDDQVKLRGYRIELGDVETALTALPGIAAAAVVVAQAEPVETATPRLVAYVVPAVVPGAVRNPGADAGEATQHSAQIAGLRTALRRVLPAYCLPEVILPLPELPRLASGKVDRRALAARALPMRSPEPNADAQAASAACEPALNCVLATLFPGQELTPDLDLFDDLGAHSLLIARLVSLLRQDARFARISVRDCYRDRTLAALTTTLRRLAGEAIAGSDAASAHAAIAQSAKPTPQRAGAAWPCAIVQGPCIAVLSAIQVATWLLPFLTVHEVSRAHGLWAGLLAGLGAFLVLLALVPLAAVLAARLCTLGIRAGSHRLWGVTYLRCWLAERLRDLIPHHLLAGSRVQIALLRLLGARIGADVELGALAVRAPWLLRIDAGASLGQGVVIQNAHVDGTTYRLAPVHLSAGAVVASAATIDGGASIGERGKLTGLSALAADTAIPAQAVWSGIPARATPALRPPAPPPPPRMGRISDLLWCLAELAAIAVLAVVFFLPFFPVYLIIDAIDARWPILAGDLGLPALATLCLAIAPYALAALPAVLAMIALTLLVCALIRLALMPRVQPCRVGVRSATAFRIWCAGLLQSCSLAHLHGLHASVFAPLWYRLLGARVGRDTEISTALGALPGLLDLGAGTFVADGVLLGDDRVEDGWRHVRRTVVAAGAFVGNNAYVADGTTIPPRVLIGVQSVAPDSAAMAPDETWLGSPALRLPQRATAPAFAAGLTTAPSRGRRLARGSVELLRIILPGAFLVGFACAALHIVLPPLAAGDVLTAALRLLLAGPCYVLACLVFCAALKWLLIGRYRPGEHPLWSLFVWISEAVTCLYEAIAEPGCLALLRGTPFLPWALRCFGVRVGRGCWIDTTELTEFDVVELGDRVVLNADSGPQTHLFEDRIMKIGTVRIGAGAVVHGRATILYDCAVGSDCTIGPLSLVMKGESLPAGSRWSGAPAEPWR